MARVDGDRNLLFGLLALQNNFIDRNALLDAFNRWVNDRAVPLGRILCDRGGLKPDEHELLLALVAKHLEKFGGDPEKSLQHLSSIGSMREDLSRIADSDLQASLSRVSAARADDDPYRTATQPNLGASTSTGTRFRVLRPHARGGLGQVSVALDRELDRPVALKEIQDRHADKAENRARFVQEAEITGKLEHPGIIPVYGLGHDLTGRPFYAMRFIQGDSLKEAIAAFHGDGVLSQDPGRRMARLRELLRRFTDVCNAVAYAHSRGVLHRDLKPGNIMLGPYGETLVVDWGLAKPMGLAPAGEPASFEGLTVADGPIRLSGLSGSRDETAPGQMVGTPAYASPEQMAGRLDLLGPASDVYGLGATLYALLTGRAPLESGEIEDVLRRVQRGEIPPPRSIDPGIPRPLEAICRKAIALNPDDRYGSARALADDVTRWLDDEPVSAHPEPLSMRVRRWGRRHRIVVTSAILCLFTASILLAVSLVLVQREKTKTSQALQEADLNYEHARQAVDDYFVLVSEEKLLNEPGMQPLRKRLLESALDYHQRFRREGARDPRRLADVAQSHYRFAMIAEEIGQTGNALAAYERALALFEELAQSGRATREGRVRLADCLERIGSLRQQVGQASDSFSPIEEAIRQYRDLLKEHPSDEAIRIGLSKAYFDMGRLHHSSRKLADAERSQQEAIHLLEALVNEQPGAARHKITLAYYYQNYSIILADQRRPPMPILLRSRKLLEELVGDEPSSYRLRYELAKVTFRIGQIYIRVGRTAQAMAEFDRTRTLLEPVVEGNPTVSSFRKALTGAYEMLATVGRDEMDDAPLPAREFGYLEKAYANAERLFREDPTLSENVHQYGSCCAAMGVELLRRGKPKDAVESLERAYAALAATVERNPTNPFLRGSLSSCCLNKGLALARSGDHVKAVASYREGIRLYRALFPGGMHSSGDAADRKAYKDLIASLQALGRAGEIVEAVAEYSTTVGGEPEDIYDAASYLARCVPVAYGSARDAVASEAAKILGKSVAAGWRDAVHTARDPDLAPLRDRDDFRRLLAEMFDRGFPDDPFAH